MTVNFKFVYSGILAKQRYEIYDTIGELEFFKVPGDDNVYNCYEACVPIIKINEV